MRDPKLQQHPKPQPKPQLQPQQQPAPRNLKSDKSALIKRKPPRPPSVLKQLQQQKKLELEQQKKREQELQNQLQLEQQTSPQLQPNHQQLHQPPQPHVNPQPKQKQQPPQQPNQQQLHQPHVNPQPKQKQQPLQQTHQPGELQQQLHHFLHKHIPDDSHPILPNNTHNTSYPDALHTPSHLPPRLISVHTSNPNNQHNFNQTSTSNINNERNYINYQPSASNESESPTELTCPNVQTNQNTVNPNNYTNNNYYRDISTEPNYTNVLADNSTDDDPCNSPAINTDLANNTDPANINDNSPDNNNNNNDSKQLAQQKLNYFKQWRRSLPPAPPLPDKKGPKRQPPKSPKENTNWHGRALPPPPPPPKKLGQ